ncbi:Crp/Fnr family transcriptional regulator [Pusillimonas sp. SM2304]|uniref:Crp/Fnr family transcriptional regulator n=1 Tax=Pusillimonas sp. SM2304 TaxID=3073241 RepID=UPI0028764084|nr:Crp/Fnr family transcriptional regulator [Pusillimonas sp. SM2304]MDS1139930.1 Crp/Fnr family transcriptional regulator [Pusillimonas sp. SM2304]
MDRIDTFSSWDAARDLGTLWRSRSRLGRTFAVQPGQSLYSQGSRHDSFYLVESGFIHTTVLRPDGTALLLEIFGPQAIFGEATAFIGTKRYVTAVAVTPATVTEFSATQMTRIFETDAALSVSLIQLLGIKHRILIAKLMSFVSDSPEVRVGGLLGRIALIAQEGRDEPVNIDLTHEQLASMTALSRVTITRVLKSLADQKLLSTHYGVIKVAAPSALIDLVPRI